MPVFQLDRHYKIIVNPEAAKLVPELKTLTEEQLWYTILVADYKDGPFRLLPIEERRLMAARKIYGKDKILKEDRIKHAMEAYKSLVFDIRRETLDALKTKALKLHQELLKDSITPRQIQDIEKSLSFIENRIISIEKDLDMEEQESIEIRGNKKLSMIEKWQRNQKKYHEYQREI